MTHNHSGLLLLDLLVRKNTRSKIEMAMKAKCHDLFFVLENNILFAVLMFLMTRSMTDLLCSTLQHTSWTGWNVESSATWC